MVSLLFRSLCSALRNGYAVTKLCALRIDRAAACSGVSRKWVQGTLAFSQLRKWVEDRHGRRPAVRDVVIVGAENLHVLVRLFAERVIVQVMHMEALARIMLRLFVGHPAALGF